MPAYPAQRSVDPQEIADAVALLVSDSASGINGEAITIALGGVWWAIMWRRYSAVG
jgi:NAD(P)-dependent dehydrogenase (short-subunit alcohol dehydrogenase family)